MNCNKGGSLSENGQKGKSLVRKPSIRNKKPPEVKQTLTSKYRFLKANPLLVNELEKVICNNNKADEQLLNKKPLRTLATVLDVSSDVLSGKLYPVEMNSTKAEKLGNFSSNKPKMKIYPKAGPSFNHSNSTKIDFKSGHFLSSTVIENKQEFTKKVTKFGEFCNRTSSLKPKNQLMQGKPKAKEPVRRSLSVQHFDIKRKNTNSNTLRHIKSQSLEELKITKGKFDRIEELNISTITEETSFTAAKSSSTPPQMVFRTPIAHHRRSAFWTPSNTNNRKSLFLSTPSSYDMSKRLNEWLKRRGKNSGDYHHLKCFGIHEKQMEAVIDEDNKENVKINSATRGSYEDLKIVTKRENDECTSVNPVNLKIVALEALQDLHKLILEGYPSEQCDVWLQLIKEKCKKLDEEPQYWECRAALEQSKGNISVAVECFKTAIVQGAEVHAVDQSLDQLLQKFSLLNIATDTNVNHNRERARIIQDARNVFKSSIIQFAVQERTLKKKNKEGIAPGTKLVITPVRRSTRSSRSGFTSTPGMKIYSSLQEAESSTEHTINFQCNKALNN